MDFVWWEKITNAAHFLNLIVERIQEGCSVMLQLPATIPWYTTMHDMVSDEITRQNSIRALQSITDEGEDPGYYLFQRYCKREKRAQYRPGIGYAKFLACSDEIALNNYILWITDVSKEQANKWYEFIQSYNKELGKERRGCTFLIETRSDQMFREQGRLKTVIYKKEIEYYDNYLFNMLAAGSLKESVVFKQYLAEAVTLLIPDDVELSAECIRRGRAFLENPIETLTEIMESELRSDQTSFSFVVNEKQLFERLWEAQIKVVFPVIEKQRNSIINRYRKDIESILPVTGAYGEIAYEAEEVEIGILSHLVTQGKLQVSYEDSKIISRLRNARNVLAHIKALPQKEVDEIFAIENGILCTSKNVR